MGKSGGSNMEPPNDSNPRSDVGSNVLHDGNDEDNQMENNTNPSSIIQKSSCQEGNGSLSVPPSSETLLTR